MAVVADPSWTGSRRLDGPIPSNPRRRFHLPQQPDRFEDLPDHRLDALTDEQLLRYVASARAAGAGDAGQRALQILIFRNLPTVRARVRGKVPEHLVEDVAHDAMVEAITASFGGTEFPQFFKWLNVIVSRHIAVFYRGRGGRQLELDREGAARPRDEDGELLPLPGEQSEGGTGLADLEDVIDRVLTELGEAHRDVVERYVFDDCSARETAEATGETEANVYKIAQRFRDELRRRLEEAEQDPGRHGRDDRDTEEDAA